MRILRWSAAALFLLVACATQAAAQSAAVITDPVLRQAQSVALAGVVSAALEKSHVLKASAGVIRQLQVTTLAAGWVMLFDATSAPTDGAVTPVWCQAVAIGSYSQDWQLSPRKFATGITVEFSTNAAGCFSATGANAFFSAEVQ